MKTICLCLFLCSIVPLTSHAYSAPGHQAIGIAALEMLPDKVRAKVKEILGTDAIEDAAVWFDHVRDQGKGRFTFPDPAEQAASVKFNADFKGNASWHFVNSPIGLLKYDPDGKFASSTDVVHSIQLVIGVLEGAPSKMTKKEALRILIHLVGDIHQPMHCVTGYYDISDMANPKLLTPAQVKNPATTTEDRGGNQLFYTKSEQLHEFWDKTLPAATASAAKDLATKIKVDLSKQPVTTGNYHKWAETWATNTMVEGNKAYEGFVFQSAAMVSDPSHPGSAPQLHISVKLPGSTSKYKAGQLKRSEQQLTLAATHLAQLLSKVKF